MNHPVETRPLHLDVLNKSLELVILRDVELFDDHHFWMLVPQLQQVCGLVRIPACGDDVLGRDGRSLDQLTDKFEANASRGPCDEDTSCEHSVRLKLLCLLV